MSETAQEKAHHCIMALYEPLPQGPSAAQAEAAIHEAFAQADAHKGMMTRRDIIERFIAGYEFCVEEDWEGVSASCGALEALAAVLGYERRGRPSQWYELALAEKAEREGKDDDRPTDSTG